ncbi:SDR family oxidoreductase [Paenibacillus sp. P96]|uniref:SDR family oxidoreductase n=1 Tax=Paenibacillus zeirhizosphaerae TaxID=2987519 RepID=A0ABT9FMM8_9BACL|nr:SDR family oxidoreductase [Paenibacillus sp. P96]MDP4095993.1 SDR family oxidoreductase [Paenibacillus sp. P96]
MNPIYPYYKKETVCKEQVFTFPPQKQPLPGLESLMNPRPISEAPSLRGSGKLDGKTILITGGDSGIGKAAAIAFAKEGANVAIAYLSERSDAEETRQRIEHHGGRCLLIETDLKHKANCTRSVQDTVRTFGKLDILVNNHAVQYERNSILDITEEQLYNVFQTNIISYFFLIQAALPHLSSGSSIINTASVVAYEGYPPLIDYSATKGAVVTLTRSLARSLAHQNIRVNCVAPGPVWTPLIPASLSPYNVSTFGSDTALGRASQPYELAAAYVYLAGDDSSSVTGECIHINGGAMVTT